MMKNVLIALVLVVAFAAPAAADRITPMLPTDYNGNAASPLSWYNGSEWVADTRPMVSTADTQPVQSAPYTSQAFDADTFIDLVVPVALTLGSEYNLLIVTCDTDCVVSFDSTTIGVGYGDLVQAYAPFVYPYRAGTIYAIPRLAGWASDGSVIRVRGLR